MKIISCIEPGKLEYRDIPEPVCPPGHSIIKIRRIGICGTDIHAFGGTQPYFSYPRVLGHELAAEFVEGDSQQLRKGDIVTVIPYQHCGSCIACRNGNTNCCQNMKVIGVHTDGGMAEFLVVPSHLLLPAAGLAPDMLALVEPFAIAAHAVRRAAILPDENVLVIGAGPIGLATMEMASVAGANVLAIDVNDNRLTWAKKIAGVKIAINAFDDHLDEKLREATDGDMPAVVIDATGNLNAINNAFRFMSHAGRYVLVGLQKGTIGFSHPEFHKREGTLLSSRNATRKDFDHVLENIRIGRINPEHYITHKIHFDNMVQEFPSLITDEGIVKAMINLDQDDVSS
ncbi:zinc-binding alcohol dehydrogenase family protein [Chitinophaga tropicalis]|uniref:Alcohol dehydrogenase catalytic domain-containing protein n=1 Tax=Chitinophaga tropicalis TaxID=2683588 RepID=A0A7K1U349_9BACT|nr:zinc-binding alcohol dehydrogenase family protein [Chitinophaga tropicalis]MVT08794.1 alcohol dehydrogenase catalytic domain-containing protein [Chitinophaga tropicalis]